MCRPSASRPAIAYNDKHSLLISCNLIHLLIPSTYQSDVLVNGIDAGTGVFIVQRTANDLLDSQDNTVLAAQADQGAALLDRLARIVNLEDATVRRELRSRQIVLIQIPKNSPMGH